MISSFGPGYRRVRRFAACRTLLVGLLVAILVSSCGGPPQSSTPVRQASVGIHQDIHFDHEKIASLVARSRAIGLQWVRFQVLWENIQPDGPGSFNWDQYDLTFEKLRGSGLKPIGVLNGTPPWARAQNCKADGCPPADPAQFSRFAATVAERYRSQAAAWEVWNEPNIDSAWEPSPDPAAYTALLRATYPAVKKAAPESTVLTAGLSPAGYEEGVSYAPVEFLDAIYRFGAGGNFDAVGWHPYLEPQLMGRYDPGSAWSQMTDTPISARSVMKANGDGDKKIWATEFGVSTSPASYPEEVQAQTLATAVRLWTTYDFAGPLIIFNFRDKALDPTARNQYYGIVHPDDSPKPAAAAIAEAIRSAG